MLAAGGDYDSSGAPTDQAELYDPGTGLWTQTAPLPQVRAWHTATLLPGGQVLVAGGMAYDVGPSYSTNTGVLFDPVAEAWQPVPSLMADARYLQRAQVLADGNVLIVGGLDATGALARAAELFVISSSVLGGFCQDGVCGGTSSACGQ